MKELSKSESLIMYHLWNLERAYMKDIMDTFSDPKPAYTTVATLLTRMTKKGLVGFEQQGKVRCYYPAVKKSHYFTGQFKSLVHTFFGDSSAQFASFFTKNAEMNQKELEELKTLIDHRLNQLKK